MVGDAPAGDVEGGAVIHGGAYEGQSEVDADALFEAVHFYGNVALVVIHGQHNVVSAADGLVEDHVGRDGALGEDAPALCVLHRGGDGFGLFASQQAAVAGVGFRAAAAIRGSGEAPSAEAIMGQLQHGENALSGDIIAGHAKGAMGGEVNDAQAAGD